MMDSEQQQQKIISLFVFFFFWSLDPLFLLATITITRKMAKVAIGPTLMGVYPAGRERESFSSWADSNKEIDSLTAANTAAARKQA